MAWRAPYALFTRRSTATSCSSVLPARARLPIRSSVCLNSARLPPTWSLAPSVAACMRRAPCRSPTRCRAGATNSLVESLGRIRLGIAERRRPGHHLSNQPAADRAERQTPMRVAVIEPKARLAWRAPDHRPGIGKARPRSHPGLRLFLFTQREQIARRRHQPLELIGRRRGIAVGEFRPGGQADALLHRRKAIAVRGIDN